MNQTNTELASSKKGTEFIATGKRKCSIARVRLTSGEGKIVVNGKDAPDYFARQSLMMLAVRPFELTGTTGKFDVKANIIGGGISGQAGALRHGIAKALLAMNADLRKPLKSDGMLTRDAREKERRKVGCRKARRKPQYSKR
jgi:small subunit ribosomal protein S9